MEDNAQKSSNHVIFSPEEGKGGFDNIGDKPSINKMILLWSQSHSLDKEHSIVL